MFSSIARLTLLASALSTAVVLAAPFEAPAPAQRLVARATAEFLPSSAELQGKWALQGCSPDPYRLNPVIWGVDYQEIDTIDQCLSACDAVGAHFCAVGELAVERAMRWALM